MNVSKKIHIKYLKRFLRYKVKTEKSILSILGNVNTARFSEIY